MKKKLKKEKREASDHIDLQNLDRIEFIKKENNTWMLIVSLIGFITYFIIKEL